MYISKAYGDVTQHKSGMIVHAFNWNNINWNNEQLIHKNWGNKIFRDAVASHETTSATIDLDVRFRHGPAVHSATVFMLESGVKIVLKQESKQGIAAGQFAVLYDGDICLGGGIIEQAL